MPPRYQNGDNIIGWISTFERHTQEQNDNKKPNSTYLEIKKALMRLMSRQVENCESVYSFVDRTQTETENLFQFVGELKKLAREAFDKESVDREELIKDRFILGIKDDRIKEKLCSTLSLTLGEMVELASEWEKSSSVFKKPRAEKKFLNILQMSSAKTSDIHISCRAPLKVEDKLVVFDLDTGTFISAVSSSIFNCLNPKPRLIKNNREIMEAVKR
ncbi:unnamed protein product [Brachionus calyciflorus]|uniref:Uncharacterized protein n=1 Tax=Brachionus calyciflorus TaxID=104777 RepID=A0A813ZZT8_9BILA|nr:unnamed protein product [Brachionus calyciflorus]